MICYATSGDDVYIFLGLTGSSLMDCHHPLERRYQQQLCLSYKLHKLWTQDRAPKNVHYFIGPNDEEPWDILPSLLPPDWLYDSGRMQKIVFILVERRQPFRPNKFTFAEQWVSATETIIQSLARRVTCQLNVDHPDHSIGIASLGYTIAKVDWFCKSTDTVVMKRVAALTAGKNVELSVNALYREHLEDLPRRLRSLTTPYNSCRHILPSISSLQHLRVLTLTSESNSILPVFDLGHDSFSCLEEFKSEMLPFYALIRVCEAIGGTLKKLDVDLPELSSHSDLSRLACALSQRSRSSLQNVHIRIHKANCSEDRSWRNILPFQSLVSIRSFKLEHVRPIVLSASDVQTLLSAWPNAITISLNPSLAIPRQAACEFSDIDGPPTLEHFGIVIDPRVERKRLVQRSSLGPMHPSKGSNLKILDIGSFRVAENEYKLRAVPVTHGSCSGCNVRYNSDA